MPSFVIGLVLGLVLIFLGSACAKKTVPVSGAVALKGEQGSETGRDPSGSGASNRLNDAEIGFEGLSESSTPEEQVRGGNAGDSTRDGVGDREGIKGLEDVFFAYDRAVLHQGSKETLQDNAKQLSIHPRAKIQIQGHTDERGSNEYNLTLGARRARTVKQFLEALGVESHRIRIISFGEEKPFCKKSRESCWKLNRRVHFMLQP